MSGTWGVLGVYLRNRSGGKTAFVHALTRKHYQSLPQISLSTTNKQQMSQADTLFVFR